MNEVLLRIKEFYTHIGMSSRAFAIKIDFNYSTLTGYLGGRRANIDISLLQKTLRTFSELSAEWLMRGEGKMLIDSGMNSNDVISQASESPNDTIDYGRIAKLIDTVAFQQGTITAQSAKLSESEAKVKRLEAELAMLRGQKNVI